MGWLVIFFIADYIRVPVHLSSVYTLYPYSLRYFCSIVTLPVSNDLWQTMRIIEDIAVA